MCTCRAIRGPSSIEDQSHRRATTLNSLRLLLLVRSLIASRSRHGDGKEKGAYLVSGVAGQSANPGGDGCTGLVHDGLKRRGLIFVVR